MPQRASVHSYRADSGRAMSSQAPTAAAKPTGKAGPSSSARRTGYTIVHAGHQFRLGPITFWIAVGSLVVMAGWSLATGTYFAFHDDVLSRLIVRQKDQQFAYEYRIAELRAQVDRITSRQLLNQEQFEQKLEQVMRRQATLESRASTLAGVPDPVHTGSIKSRPAPMADPPPGETPKASPISDTVIFTAPPDREARLESRELPAPARRIAAAAKPSAIGVEGALARLQVSLDRVEARQTASLNTLEERFDSKAKRIRSVLADLGLDGKKVPRGVQVAAVGGPFVPLTLRKDAGTFERQLYRIHVARANVEKLTRTLGAVPVRKPIMGEIDLSSGFGVRSDPFLGRPALHSGLDFRSSTGDPVRATANGVVETAGWNGGYGKMVEIDHGNGFSTRYGHMSEIDVKVGQQIKIGQIVGRVGSTGRSTGPHLHYETRIDGDAVDPQKFLRAGLRLGNAL
jgi:murein DD-endopeptidase MepM/ murein hydrolase activator NlpD